MKGKCEVFEKDCIGYEGLLYDIDNLKLLCEVYRREIDCVRGEEMRWCI